MIILLVWGFVGAASNGVATITADLSRHLIAITTAFSGTDVLLFGATERAGGDVVVTVRGPEGQETVRRKNRVGPIWLNTEDMTFVEAPNFYAVASSAPIEQIAGEDVLRRHAIGIQNLDIVADDDEQASSEEQKAFRQGLIRNKQKAGLYITEPRIVEFVGPKLFRSDLHFPANVQPGSYQIEVLHLEDGQVISAQRSVLAVSKIGIEAEVFDFAREQAAFYGIACIVIAIVAGYTASVAFRRS